MPKITKIAKPEDAPVKRGRGRPKGSKNKTVADSTPRYVWECENGHKEIVHVRALDIMCGTCRKAMKPKIASSKIK